MTEPKLTQWATTNDYPGTPPPAWNGQPLKVTPPGNYFVPNTVVPAEYLNDLFNAVTGVLNQSSQGVSMLAAANWGAPVSNIDPSNLLGTVVTCATWDAYHEQWIAYCWDLGSGSSQDNAYTTYDGGKTWHIVTGLSIPPLASTYGLGVAVNPVNGQFAVIRSNTGTRALTATVGSQTAGTADTALSGHGAEAGALVALISGEMVFVGANDVSPGPYVGQAYTFNGTTWTDVTTSLPSSWQGASFEILDFLSAESTSTVAFALCGLRIGTDNSRLMTFASGTFTDVTPAFLTVHQQIRGLAYDAVDGVWALLTQDDSSPPNTRLWTTPDPLTTGSSWTNVHTFAGTWAGGVCCIGSVFCVLVNEVTNHSLGNSIYYSPNVVTAGSSCTWSRADYFDNVSLSSISEGISLMLSNGSQGFVSPECFNQPNPVALSLKAPWQTAQVANMF